MILFIDNTDYNKLTYALSDRKKNIKKSFKVDPHKSHQTLNLLKKFLLGQKIKLGKATPLPIKKIVVNSGPGSFTGTRVGVAHALALGLALNIKVVAKNKNKFALSAGVLK